MSRLALGLYALLLRLYPHRFRSEFADEMQAVFADALAEAEPRGSIALLILLWHELRDWPMAIVHARQLYSTSSQEQTLMPANRDAAKHHLDNDTSPTEALVGALPFFAFGVVCLLGKFVILPGLPLAFATFNLAFELLVVTGLLIGWSKAFPRWSYAYLYWALIFAWWWQSMGWPGSRFVFVAWGWRAWVPIGLTVVAALLITRSLAPLRQLVVGFWQDWTRLSLGLFVFLSFATLLYDESHSPILIALMLASTAVVTLAAWAYMRGPRPRWRMLALVSGFVGIAVIGYISENSWDWRAYYGVSAPAHPEFEVLRQAVVLALWMAVLLGPALLGLLHRAGRGQPAH